MARGVCALTLVCFAGLLGWAGNAPAPADLPAAVPDVKPIAITPSDGFNLAVVDQPDDHYVVVKLTSAAHNWWAASFTNLPTDAPTTIGLNMTGNDTKGNKADVKKWIGLVPVLSYADPTKYESYECFAKGDDGVWRSTDVLKPEKEREAGKGKCPEQTAIPKDLAEEFLSKDGKSWEPWREVEKAEAVTAHNVFRITHRFRQATATVAMRVPFTYTYLLTYLARLEAAELPGVTIDLVGLSAEGRPLRAIRIEPTQAMQDGRGDRPAMVIMYAREHATEQDGSWAVLGALNHIVRNAASVTGASREVRWLLVPVLDPDAAVHSEFTVGDIFTAAPPVRTEALVYGRYLISSAEEGKHPDVVVNLHSVECDECPHISVPMLCAVHTEYARGAAETVFARSQAAGFIAGRLDDRTVVGFMGARLGGWCADKFSSLDLPLEVNSRFPGRRLSLAGLARLGDELAATAATWVTGERAQLLRTERDRHIALWREARAAWWLRTGRTPGHRNPFNLLTMGY